MTFFRWLLTLNLGSVMKQTTRSRVSVPPISLFHAYHLTLFREFEFILFLVALFCRFTFSFSLMVINSCLIHTDWSKSWGISLSCTWRKGNTLCSFFLSMNAVYLLLSLACLLGDFTLLLTATSTALRWSFTASPT